MIFKLLFLVRLVLEELIRLPVQLRQRQSRKANRVLVDALPASNTGLDILAFAGLEIVPVIYFIGCARRKKKKVYSRILEKPTKPTWRRLDECCRVSENNSATIQVYLLPGR